MKNIAEMLKNTALLEPNKVGLSYEGGELTWMEIYNLSLVLKNKLRLAHVTKGQRVGIYIDHKPEQVVAIFGIALADAAFSIISPLLKPNQIKHQIIDADIDVIVTTDDQIEHIEEIFGHRPHLIVPISIDKFLRIKPKEDEKDQTSNIPADVACIIYTSGSTGNPKGVVIPGRTLLDGARIVSGYLNINGSDVILSILPYSFDYGLNQLLSVTYKGARIVMRKFTLPQEIMNTLLEEKITGFAAVPSMWVHFFNPKFLSQNKDFVLENLKYITSAGGKHPPELLKKLDVLFPKADIIIMYGLTESFRSTYLPASELLKRHGSIGKPVPEVDIMVVNEEGNLCLPGERGELIHRGAFISYGYLNAPDLTNQKFVEIPTGGMGCRPEIAVRSGDIVSMDEDGFIYFHERSDTQIKSSGYRISPSQVEEVGFLVPDIKQVAVYGVPDHDTGEAVSLAYSSHSGKVIEISVFRKHFIPYLPNYSIPKVYRHYTTLPHTPNGKVDYAALKKGHSSD